MKTKRDKRYEILDINQSARSEMQGNELLAVMQGGESCPDKLHIDCGHTNVVQAYGKFGNKTELLEVYSTHELKTSENLQDKELHRIILKFRDWSVMHSQGGHNCTYMRLHPLYLEMVKHYGKVFGKGLHVVYKKR